MIGDFPFDLDGGERRFGESPVYHLRSCKVHCWQRWPKRHGAHSRCCRCETVRERKTEEA